jgi:hypothetical protein
VGGETWDLGRWRFTSFLSNEQPRYVLDTKREGKLRSLIIPFPSVQDFPGLFWTLVGGGIYPHYIPIVQQPPVCLGHKEGGEIEIPYHPFSKCPRLPRSVVDFKWEGSLISYLSPLSRLQGRGEKGGFPPLPSPSVKRIRRREKSSSCPLTF